MILKKPYAFIIRHFRLIHLLLLIPMFYLVSKTKDIFSFFSEYINNSYSIPNGVILENLSSQFINIFMYIALVAILVVMLLMAFILQNKNKPTKFYNTAIVYYVVLLILLTTCYSVFGLFETDTLDNFLARILRDFALVAHYSEYLFIVLTLIRGVGFNIRQFNFQNDLEGLKISSEDDEEFEFLVGRDMYKTKRTIRRFFRELSYYYKENKFIFSVIFLVIIILIGTSIYKNRAIKGHVYKENETLAFGNLQMTIKDSFISYINLSGEDIGKDKAYVILQVSLNNRYVDNQVFNYSNLRLVANGVMASPNLSLGNYFTDFGTPLTSAQVAGNTNYNYVLVYEIDKNEVASSYVLQTYYGFDSTAEEDKIKTHNIMINPSIINNNNGQTTKVSKGTSVDLKDTLLGKSSFAIKDYALMNRFTYVVNGVSRDIYINLIKSSSYTLMVLDYDLVLDPDANYMISNKNFANFFNDFLKIEYTVNGEVYKSKVAILNPKNYTEKLVFEINKNILNADSIIAVVTIRNMNYEVKLK